VIWIIVCVTLGALTTLALAWGPEVWRVVSWKPGQPVGTVDLFTYESTAPDGRVYRASCRDQGFRGEEWTLDPKELTAALEPQLETGPWPKRTPPNWVPWPKPDRQKEDGSSLFQHSSATACGWPARSLCYRSLTTESNRTYDISQSGEVLWVWGGYSHALPGSVIWRGLLADTLLFGGAFWLLIRWPGGLRRWRRRRSGHCIACGYNRRGLSDAAQCPECGAAGSTGIH
jgi:hypothetical protein